MNSVFFQERLRWLHKVDDRFFCNECPVVRQQVVGLENSIFMTGKPSRDAPIVHI